MASSPVMNLDLEDYEDVETLMEKAALSPDGALTAWEVSFAADFLPKVAKFGTRLRITEKQWEALKRMGNKLGVELQY